jgi:hypothetical protein
LYTTVMAGANSTRQDSIFHVVAEIIRGLVLGLGTIRRAQCVFVAAATQCLRARILHGTMQ